MKKNYIILFIGLTLILFSFVGYYLSETGTFDAKTTLMVDMAGRNVNVSTPVTKVLSTSPTPTVLTYMLAPDKLIAFNYQTTKEEQRYMPDKYKSLESVGGWFGAQSGNYEQFILMEPDVVFESVTISNSSYKGYHTSNTDMLKQRQTKFGEIPVVGVNDTSDIVNLNPSILFMGKILGANEKANKLAEFNTKSQKEVTNVVSKIPEDEKVRVYYAEDTDGLKTDPSGSVHGQLIDFCGGKNVADVRIQGGKGQTDVSMEQVLKWNPEVIITTDPHFYKSVVYNDSNWKNVEAVKNKRVYLSPQSPFKWFDRPTGSNMIIGIPWTAKILYPDKFKNLDLKSEVKYFYKEFYHYDLSDDEVKELLLSSGINESMIS